jgi:hypothetical protein
MMKVELIRRHHADAEILVENPQHHPSVVKLNITTDAIHDHVDWCVNNLTMDSWTWGHESMVTESGRAMFTFKNHEDAILFQMTWT